MIIKVSCQSYAKVLPLILTQIVELTVFVKVI